MAALAAALGTALCLTACDYEFGLIPLPTGSNTTIPEEILHPEKTEVGSVTSSSTQTSTSTSKPTTSSTSTSSTTKPSIIH